jgi:hypothetical protein
MAQLIVEGDHWLGCMSYGPTGRARPFTALFHHVGVAALERAFRRLRRRAAPGVDGMTVVAYEGELESNLQALHARLRRTDIDPCRFGEPDTQAFLRRVRRA